MAKNSKVWYLVYGKLNYKEGLPTLNIGLYKGHCFYIKSLSGLCKKFECQGCHQIFTGVNNLWRHKDRCTGGETKVICTGSRIKHIMNSSEKIFYGGNTQFSYSGCQWIESESQKIGHHIHHAM